MHPICAARTGWRGNPVGLDTRGAGRSVARTRESLERQWASGTGNAKRTVGCHSRFV